MLIDDVSSHLPCLEDRYQVRSNKKRLELERRTPSLG